MNKNSLIKTIILCIVFILFISFMFYVIYVYGIYDKKNKDSYLEEFNNGNFSYVYNNLINNGKSEFVTEDKYNDVIELMYNKNVLNEIYKNYYMKEYENKDDFFNDYFFGYNDISLKNIDFTSKGKTSLFSRKKIFYKYITVTNKSGVKSKIGVFNDIKFKVPGNGELFVDDIKVECNQECVIPEMFGGIHKVSYGFDDKQYFGLINVGYDINFDLMDIMVEVVNNNEEETSKDIEQVSLETGRYTLKECYLESSCPYRSYSYIDLRDDGTVTMYIYISLDISGDTYEGTYEVKNGFLYLKFDKHSYKMHDYDTLEHTTIDSYLNIEKSFKIVNSREISNYDYSFVLK